MRVFLMMVFLTCAAPLAGLALHSDTVSNVRLVIISPWQDAPTLIAAAGGRILGPARAPVAVLARTDTPAQFDDAARKHGALWVLDGRAIAAICGVAL